MRSKWFPRQCDAGRDESVTQNQCIHVGVRISSHTTIVHIMNAGATANTSSSASSPVFASSLPLLPHAPVSAKREGLGSAAARVRGGVMASAAVRGSAAVQATASSAWARAWTGGRMWPRGEPNFVAQAWQAWAQTVVLPSWVPCPSRCGGGAGSHARMVG